MQRKSADGMSIEEINRRIDQLRGEILAQFGIGWKPQENTSATNTENEALMKL